MKWLARCWTQGRRYARAHWRLILGGLAGLAVICGLLLFRLGSLSGGLTAAEIGQANFASSWRHIAHNPLNLPLTCTQWLILTIIPHHGNTVTRAASPIFGVLSILAFAYILRRWYGLRSAVYGTFIFGLSSWLLHVSRYASVDVLYLWAVPTLLAILIAWERHQQRPRIVYLVAAGLVMLLYVPGMVWLVLAGVSLQPKLVKQALRSIKTPLSLALFSSLTLLLSLLLLIAFARHPDLIASWLGLPKHLPGLNALAHNLLHSVSFFVYRGPATPELWLVRVPILSFFSTVMGVLGILFYAKHLRAARTRLLIAYCVLGALLFAMGGPVTISILVPLVYLVVAAGFGYLLHEWLHVFPRNPLARGLGFGLLAAAVGITCLYNLKAYYIAWPHNSATQAAYHEPR